MIVLDCNAALAMAMSTKEGIALSMLALADEETIAPRLFYAELSHTLGKYEKGGYFTKQQLIVLGKDAVGLVDTFYEDADLWIESFTGSVFWDHSSYDLFYLILAQRTGSTLFTLDKKLMQLCERHDVACVHDIDF